MKQKRCFEENKCGFCGKVMNGDRRGNWKYYCNQNCMDRAREDFNQAIRELFKGKHIYML